MIRHGGYSSTASPRYIIDRKTWFTKTPSQQKFEASGEDRETHTEFFATLDDDIRRNNEVTSESLFYKYASAADILRARKENPQHLLDMVHEKVSEGVTNYPMLLIRIRQLFEAFDLNGDGYLDHKQFHAHMDKMGIALDKVQNLALFGYFDDNLDGLVDWEEFAECTLGNITTGVDVTGTSNSATISASLSNKVVSQQQQQQSATMLVKSESGRRLLPRQASRSKILSGGADRCNLAITTSTSGNTVATSTSGNTVATSSNTNSSSVALPPLRSTSVSIPAATTSSSTSARSSSTISGGTAAATAAAVCGSAGRPAVIPAQVHAHADTAVVRQYQPAMRELLRRRAEKPSASADSTASTSASTRFNTGTTTTTSSTTSSTPGSVSASASASGMTCSRTAVVAAAEANSLHHPRHTGTELLIQRELLQRVQIKMQERTNSYSVRLIQTRKWFDVSDVNQDGMLDLREFHAFLLGLGLQFEEIETICVFAYFDENCDGYIQWDEFATHAMGQPDRGSATATATATSTISTSTSTSTPTLPNLLQATPHQYIYPRAAGVKSPANHHHHHHHHHHHEHEHHHHEHEHHHHEHEHDSSYSSSRTPSKLSDKVVLNDPSADVEVHYPAVRPTSINTRIHTTSTTSTTNTTY